MIQQIRRFGDSVFPTIGIAFACAAAFVTALSIGVQASAQTAGAFDTTFGSNGRVKNLLPLATGEASAYALALQPDGKILIAGSCTPAPSSDQQVCLSRMLPNGDLDATFDGPDGNGNGRFGFPTLTDWSVAKRILVKPDGRIVVAAECRINNVVRVCVAWLNADGSFDTTRGAGTGRTIYNPGRVVAMQLQPDGKIVFATYCSDNGDLRFCMFRINPSDAYDGTFDGPSGNGNGGFALTVFGLGVEEPAAMALQTDGKIVVVGRCLGPSGYGLCVTRLTADGSFDSSFDGPTGNGNGRTVFSINGGDQAVGTSVVIAPDGRILVGGFCGSSSDSYRFCGARLLPNGDFDPEFLGTTGDTPGRFRFSVLGARAEAIQAIALQSDGRILLAGYCENAPVPMTNGLDFCFARLNSDGSLDRTFDGPNASGNGKFMLGIANDYDYLTGLAVRTDGKIVAAGTCSDTCGGSCGGNAFCVARFHGGSQGFEACSLDIDGDGVIGVTDAIINARVALGFRGSALVDGLSFAANASRSSLNAVRDYLVANCGLVSL